MKLEEKMIYSAGKAVGIAVHQTSFAWKDAFRENNICKIVLRNSTVYAFDDLNFSFAKILNLSYRLLGSFTIQWELYYFAV